MKKRIVENIYAWIVIGGIVLFSLALLACPELPSDGSDSSTKKDSTPPSPYSFSDSLAKVLYTAFKEKQVPADAVVNDDKSKAAGIIFRRLRAKEGGTLSVIHVGDKGDDTNDGSTWTKAKRTIKAALDDITDASANNLYLVLIGSGTYKITETLNMQNYVAIIGGFDASNDGKSGYESNTATIISGGDSVQVFKNKDLDTQKQKSTAVLAGVTITMGKSENGGGMGNDKSSPTITHTTFSQNTATSGGGGMSNDKSSPTITHTTFSQNTATSGGGMSNDKSSPTITHTTFSENNAGYGGGMFNDKSSSTIMHTTFSGNTADSGGGMHNYENSSPEITYTTFSENNANYGGGMHNEVNSSPEITHTTFSGNTAGSGGGMGNTESSPTITHTTFSKNTVTDDGGGMYNEYSSFPKISSSIFWGNTDNSGNTSKQIENSDSSIPVVAHSIVQGGYADGTAIIDQNPLLDTLKDNGGFVETIAIPAKSPAINKGLYVARTRTTYYYSENGTDWFTDPKLTKGKTSNLPADATPYTTDARGYTYNGRPDMGAYEYGGTAPELPSDGSDSSTKKDSTPPSPYSFSDSLAKVLYDAVQNEKVPADAVVNDDKSKAAGIIFRRLRAKEGGTLSVIHVGDKGDDTNDGSTWTKAKLTIKSALADIKDASANNLYLVLIGSGTYKITETLNMQNYVAIIGGFDASSDGKSEYERSEATIISGEDSVQVFENKDLDTLQTRSTAVLAGVTITMGKSENGGGMYNSFSSPTITHTKFSENNAGYGGGMYNSFSSPTITHTKFSENNAGYGGGMYNHFLSPTITHTTFSKNTAKQQGGGMYNSSSLPTITHTTFSQNSADRSSGGGMYNSSSSLTITHTTLSQNTAKNGVGGGMYNIESAPTIMHTTLSQNTAKNGGGMFNFNNSSPTISSSIFRGNINSVGNTSKQIENSDGSIPVVAHSIVQGGYGANDSANDIIDQNPLLDTLKDNGGFVKTIAIKTGSPAINMGLYVARTRTTYYYSENGTDWFTDPKLTTGKTSSLPADATPYTTDARGYIYNGRPDMGAYEYGGTAP